MVDEGPNKHWDVVGEVMSVNFATDLSDQECREKYVDTKRGDILCCP